MNELVAVIGHMMQGRMAHCLDSVPKRLGVDASTLHDEVPAGIAKVANEVPFV